MKKVDRIESMLDQALEMTFPASDPYALYFPETDRAPADARARREREPRREARPTRTPR